MIYKLTDDLSLLLFILFIFTVRIYSFIQLLAASVTVCSINSVFSVQTLMPMSMSVSMKYLYSANSRRSNLRRWRVSD